MAAVSFEKTTRFYAGATTPAVDALDLTIADGEFLVLVGPSGCGKSTTLRMLAGLEGVDEGALRIGDRDVTDLPPAERDLAMVFQNYALYPHMTVAENIGFHLKVRKLSRQEIDRRVADAAATLDLTPYLERKPAKLSGGQRQRVAMGRAIVRQPQVFLMDEPLSNLDAKLRVQTRTQIAALQQELGVTTVYVTHDQVEAMTLGHRVAVLRDGVLQQVDTPEALFHRPANIFVAGFIGSPGMNLVRVPAVRGIVRLGDQELAVPTPADEVVLGVRPEALRVATEGVVGVVTAVEDLGSDRYLYCATELHTVDPESGLAGAPHLVVRVAGGAGPGVGERITVSADRAAVQVFSVDDGLRLS